jgi:hypothetical protein
MRTPVSTLLCALSLGCAAAPPPANPEIDMRAFLAAAHAAAEDRDARRVDEATFAAMMREPGTVVLDARSRPMVERRHVAGAVSLSLPDFTAEALARVPTDRAARVLIYCNNNFAGDPAAFPLKVPAASLNLATRVALHSYGYRNVWELAPYVDVARTTLPLEPPVRARRGG